MRPWHGGCNPEFTAAEGRREWRDARRAAIE